MLIEFNGKKPRVAQDAFVAPNAVLIGDVEVESEASVWFGAVLRGDWNRIRVGARSSVQDNCVVHSTVKIGADIGEDCTIGHGAIIHSSTVKDGALIGINSVVLDGAVVGEEAVVSAGSVVTPGTQVPPRSLVAGAPAKTKKELSEEAIGGFKLGKDMYVALAQKYLKL